MDEFLPQQSVPLDDQHCGIVSLIGVPNAGKSTLLNTLVGQRISIVTHKAQTTRSRITGITIQDKSQVIFHDLPGVFDADKQFDKAMVRAAWSSLGEADLGLVLIDASRPLNGQKMKAMLDRLEQYVAESQALKDEAEKGAADASESQKSGQSTGMPSLILVLNKADLIEKEKLLPMAAELNERLPFEKTFMISARTGAGCKDLLAWIGNHMPANPWLYSEDDVVDLPAKLLAAEFTREQIFKHLHQEIPYGATVQTDKIENNPDGSITFHQVIFVARDGHKGMVIGKGGQMLKRIGSQARQSLTEVFGTPVHVQLMVRVKSDWSTDPDTFEMWGL